MDFHTWPAGQEPVPGHNPPDGLNDVWQHLYNAWGLDPEGDADNDGSSNYIESIAGTNPFLAGDCLKVGDMIVTANQVLFYFDAKAGKQYSIVSDDAPNGAFATEEALLAPESGASFIAATDAAGKVLRIAKPSGAPKFFKLKVCDVDSSGGGVSDWVKRRLGLDPAVTDSDGDGVSDYEQISEELQSPDEITVEATAPFASEDGPQSGAFTVRRTRCLFDARVNLGYSGTASSSSDYSRSPSAGVLEFAPGEKSADIHINPVQDSTLEGSESVTLTLSNPDSETCGTKPVLGHPASATVVINNNTAPSGTGLLAQYYDTANAAYENAANFNPGQLRITRVDPTVDFDWGAGTPNGGVIAGSDVEPDNYSSVWEGYLHPTTAGSYQFQLDADDKARVLVDLNRNGVFDLPAEQIVEHGWDGPATVGVFKQSAAHSLVVPANASQRYRIRVEFVEFEGEARCRLQWRNGTAAFANIPQAQVYTHTAAMNANYNYVRTSSTAGNMTGTITVTLNGHGLAAGNPVDLAFSSGNLFTPANGNFHGAYTVASVTSANVFVVNIAASSLPPNGTGAGFVVNRPASTTTGWLNRTYGNTTFTEPPGLVAVHGTGATTSNNGILGTGTPDVDLIHHNMFSARWTGQVQPQYTEEYTFAVHADDGCRLWINGQEMALRQTLAANVGSSTYTYTSATGETVVNYANSSIMPDSFAAGDTVRADPTAGTLTSYATTDLVVTAATSTTFTVTFPTGHGNQDTGATINIDALNRQIKPWASNGNERYVRIPMIGGTRYDIRLEYWENAGFSRCRLFWFSPSQSKQIIPSNRLYPSSVPQAPPAHTSSTDAVALVGGPFSHQVAVSNGATVSVSGLPPWLSFNPGTGLITGTPPVGAKGPVQIIVTTTGPAGTSTSLVNIDVVDTGRSIAREQWNGVAGTSIASIPLQTAPGSTGDLGSLEAASNVADNYGARIRGYITAPVSGNYYFHIAASDTAELWIANDDEPVNSLKRAWASGTGVRQWNSQPNQRSAWLRLKAGQRYYIEVLHKAGTGPDHLAVGWQLPVGGAGNGPIEVVPGYALSPHEEPSLDSVPGSLYVARMLAQGLATTSGTGSATLRLSADETSAILKFSHTPLTSPVTAQHIHADPYLANPDTIVFDIDTPQNPADGLQPDGSYKWTIEPVGTLSVADIREILKQGKAYINVHTVNYPGGEIRGNFTLADGFRSFTPPPPPPSWTDDHATNEGAVRFLTQATYGPSLQDIAALKAMSSYDAWIEDQFTKGPSYHLPEVIHMRSFNRNANFTGTLSYNAWWRNAVSAEDQLRQRMAFALLEILVVSRDGPLLNRADALSYYYDLLLDHSFGNFRELLEAMTLSPTMGRYLDMLRNDKPDLATGRIPNENYAREIMQLFSIGLYRMWPDGTLMLNSKDELIECYHQDEIIGLAHVFTGWDYGYDGADRTALNAPADPPNGWIRQMRATPVRHFTGQKLILNNEVLPGLRQIGAQPLDPYAVHNAMHFNDPAYRALAQQEIEVTHDQLFNHPNTGPLICRQLIQRFVTSNPSRDYLYRVVSAFNDNGYGVRGDLKAVIKAILLDHEARHPSFIAKTAFGKQKEPLLRVTAAARAFRNQGLSGTYSQGSPTTNNNRTITITTNTPHKLNTGTGNAVFLDFGNSTAPPGVAPPTSTTYTVAAVQSPTSFTVNARIWRGNYAYNQPAGSSVMTITAASHWLPKNGKVFIDFISGPADNVAGFDRAVHTVTESNSTDSIAGTSFQINGLPVIATARTGNAIFPRYDTGSYGVVNSGLPAPQDKRITLNTPVTSDHKLKVGDPVYINFTATNGANIKPYDGEYIVESVEDRNTFTVLTYAGNNVITNQTQNGTYMFPLAEPPRLRSGLVNSRPGTFELNAVTDLALAQTPLNSPTVFNYFMPDYKFPGAIAAQGITTPEFQLSSETNVMRQMNFIRDGVLMPNHSLASSSFNAGSNALVLDYTPWLGNAVDAGLGAGTNTTQPWTNDINLRALIDKLSLLFTASQLSAEARDIIYNHIISEGRSRSITSINVASPCTITTLETHNLTVGSQVTISGMVGGTFTLGGSPTSINGTRTVTAVPNATTFQVGINCTSNAGFNYTTSNVATSLPYPNGTLPPQIDRRNRIRAIVHLILTSADYAIQR